MWSEDIFVKRKEACRPETFSRYLACCSSLVCIVEWFDSLVDGDDSPARCLNGAVFQFLGSRMFSGAHERFFRGLHFVTVMRWEANDVNMFLSS